MSICDYRPLRWPIEIQAGVNDEIEISETANPGNAGVATITAGWYLIDGSGSLVAPSDLLAEVNTQLAVAGAALGLGNPVQVQMNSHGYIQYKGDSGDPITVDWAVGSFNKTLLGVEDSETTTSTANDAYNSTNQWGWSAGGQWSTGRPEVALTAEALRFRGSESLGYTDNPSLIKHASSDWFERQLRVNEISSARMLDYRAADALYAAYAGRVAGDPDTLERMIRYLYVGASGVSSGAAAPVWIYSSADPLTATKEGPYSIILSRCSYGLEGIKGETYQLSSGVEVFDTVTVFRRKA